MHIRSDLSNSILFHMWQILETSFLLLGWLPRGQHRDFAWQMFINHIAVLNLTYRWLTALYKLIIDKLFTSDIKCNWVCVLVSRFLWRWPIYWSWRSKTVQMPRSFYTALTCKMFFAELNYCLSCSEIAWSCFFIFKLFLMRHRVLP